MTILVKIVHSRESYFVAALIDSGLEGNFIDEETAKKFHIRLHKLEKPITLTTIDDGPIGTGKVTHRTEPIAMQVSALHHEQSTLLVTKTNRHEMILGAPWLFLHDPTTSWKKGEIIRWSPHCLNNCLKSPSLRLGSTTIESPEAKIRVLIPDVYHKFQDIFSKKKASGLPPHCPYDCTIDLLPGTSPS